MADEQADLSALDPKVIVWDLDGTLWYGTLDAGDARTPRRAAALLADFARRGIVNTVCSNNSPERGLAALRALGVERYVVLPRIEWADKSDLMSDIVDFFQVAPDRIVLVDDDAKIRARMAAQFGVVAVDPTEIERADLPRWGAESAGLERLEQYRVLARRREARSRKSRRAGSSKYEVDFLRGCATQFHRVDVTHFADRIADLSMRSNRLNLTKSRLQPDDIRRLAAAPGLECYAVKVSDRFGDYGLCGFVAFDVDSHRLDHFFWSCRVLNQGIVEHFAEQLRTVHGHRVTHPALVDFGVDIDWVTETHSPAAEQSVDSNRTSVLFIGGCDLDIVAAQMGGSRYAVTVRGLTEVDGIQQYGHSGVSVMAAQHRLDPSELAASACRLPWIGNVPGASDWSAHDVVVLSLWVDYCCMTVRYRSDLNSVWVPSYKRIDADFTAYDWDHWVGPKLTREKVADELEFGPPLTAGDVVDGLRVLTAAMPLDTRLILLNAAELDRPTTYEWGQRQDLRNRELNGVVGEFAASTANVSVLDVAAIVTSAADLVHPDEPTGFHYRRDVYAEIARRLAAEILRVDD